MRITASEMRMNNPMRVIQTADSDLTEDAILWALGEASLESGKPNEFCLWCSAKHVGIAAMILRRLKFGQLNGSTMENGSWCLMIECEENSVMVFNKGVE
jgi:hypothetical protein